MVHWGAKRIDLTANEFSLLEYLMLNAGRQVTRTMIIEHVWDRSAPVLVLYYFEELTMKEIGAIMGIDESRVSQIHSTAVVRLRAQVAGNAGKNVRKNNKPLPQEFSPAR